MPAVALSVAATAWQAAASNPLPVRVEITGARTALRNAVIRAPLPPGLSPDTRVHVVPISPAGASLPAQIGPGPSARLWWRLPGLLRAGERRLFELRAGTVPPPADEANALHVTQTPNSILVRLGDRPVLRYNKVALPTPPDVPAKFARSGYIHPVWTPAGRIVTDDFPSDHRHHHGVWFAWTKTVFEGRHPDFWNLGGLTGTVRFAAVIDTFAGPVFGGFRVRHEHLDLSAPDAPRKALDEVWTVRVWNVDPEHRAGFLWELESVQRCAEASIRFPRYRYGGIGFRGAREWGGTNCRFLTSEGRTRKDGHGTRARWCDVSGPLGTATGGVAVMSHPRNFRFPEPMRIHPSIPFFNFAPSQAGDWSMAPGQDYVFRYRFLVHDGNAVVPVLEQAWTDFAHASEVRVQFTPAAKGLER